MEKRLIITKTIIEEKYDELTDVEKIIADYFLNTSIIGDYSSKNIANLLYVSESSLSRFAKKLGFSGYREFIYALTNKVKTEEVYDKLTTTVFTRYNQLLENTYKVINTKQLKRIAMMFTKYKRIYLYGIGSSGVACMEIESRFIRLGLDIDAFIDANSIIMNTSRVNKESLVIGISLSGKTKEVIQALKIANKHQATTILCTGNKNSKNDCFDEVMILPYFKNLTVTMGISPQIPILLVFDIIYSHYLHINKDNNIKAIQEILESIDYPIEK